MDEGQQPDQGEKRLKLPPADKTAVVQCRGFRCLAYRDKDGKWRDVAHQEELPDVLEVLLEL